MTYIVDSSDTFREQLIEGYVAAYGRHVQRVPEASGVAVAGGPVRDRVAVVIGGGAGHYPASMGLVGDGLATAAVVGEVFTSPSTEQIYRVAKAVDAGAGLLFAFGNYAGDVLNFTAAAERLRAEGTPVEIVLGSDDLASAGPAESGKRRGVGGALFVYKAAGAAAARGLPLAEVARLTALANERTRTLGVAWEGCTLPGRSEPLFHVAPGTMEVGLGIHGEPGVRTSATVTAAELATVLLDPLLAERPEGVSGRVAMVLNGLGATKYEEMFVLWSRLSVLAREAGLEVVLPEVGEFMTSLDMAGCSVSVTWLDDELEALWRAPARSAGFRRGDGVQETGQRVAITASGPVAAVAEAADEPEAAVVRDVLEAMLDVVSANEAELGRIDAVAGDGDHGTGMVRGLRAATSAAASTSGTASDVLAAAARAWGDQAGGTSGALWSALLGAIADRLAGNPSSPAELAAGIADGLAAIQRLGGAEVGDKTLVDALAPFVQELTAGLATDRPLGEAWSAAVESAEQAARETARLRPRLGRARPLAERSVGTPDAGAISMALCLRAAREALIPPG